ncbi:MAG: glycerate kinase [Selenomonadaceae bacterium]|nr:glycerate kinase [Selenomonadaceae bacterium]MBR1860004.1 glycerate kinase [Selenomonadaceae bacterium]
MKVVIAIDSFKGSLSSSENANITASAIQNVMDGKADIKIFPLADGGEGTVDALTSGLNGKIVKTEVTGPLGTKITSRYGLIESSKTAVIEMADAAGLNLVPVHLRNPLNTTTYGLGELILEAANTGCRNFIIGIGGSSTNDCGIGMLAALGVKFNDKDGNPVPISGAGLKDIQTIDNSTLIPIIRECKFRIACDVKNPLYGSNGCSAIYGPQKGATPEIVDLMDTWIHSFADKIKKQLGLSGAEVEGAGAAGGLGYAFKTFLNASLEPGIDLILDAINIKSELISADIVITGEGCLDSQTVMGKAPIGVARFAKKCNPAVKVIAVCGGAAKDAAAVNEHGIDAYFPIIHMPMSVSEAMDYEVAKTNLYQTVTQIFRLISII